MLKKYYSVSPIPNLKIDSPLHMGDFDIHTTISKEILEKDYKIDLSIFNYFEKQMWLNSPIYVRNFSINEDKIDFDNAHNAARAHINHFINALVLFQPSITYIDRGPLWIFPIPEIKNGPSGKGDFPGLVEVKHHEKLKLGVDEFEEFKIFFDKCYSYFSKIEKTDLDEYIENAYYWLTKSRKNIMAYDRLISLNVLLESLVGTDQELTHRISHRCATILGKNSHERGEIYEKIRKYYGQRSTILHGSKKIIANRDLYYLAEIGRTMIIRFVSLAQNDYSQKRDELMKQLDKAVVDEELRSEIINQARELFLETADPKFENNST